MPPEEAQLVDEPECRPPVNMHGHVTSSYYSARLSRSVALAMVRRGSKRAGQILYAPLADGRIVSATIVSPVFYDPEGARQNV